MTRRMDVSCLTLVAWMFASFLNVASCSAPPQNASAFCFLQEYVTDDCQGLLTLSETSVTGMCVWKNDTKVATYAGVELLDRTTVNWTRYEYPNCTGLLSNETYPVGTCMTDGFGCSPNQPASNVSCSRLVSCYYAIPGGDNGSFGFAGPKTLGNALLFILWPLLWKHCLSWVGTPRMVVS